MIAQGSSGSCAAITYFSVQCCCGLGNSYFVMLTGVFFVRDVLHLIVGLASWKNRYLDQIVSLYAMLKHS